MNLLRRWLEHPQSVWLRRALFQVHLWTGVGLGLYILVVSVTGSILVFRIELLRAFESETLIVAQRGVRLDQDGIRDAAMAAYPGFQVTQVFEGRQQNQAVEVWMNRDGTLRQRLFDPFTGEDLGDSIPAGIRFVSWVLDLHDNLLFGEGGRTANGIASMLFTVLTLTGSVIWWPGVRSWPRSLYVQVRSNWKRINWSLHSAVGFWTLLVVFMWGVSGIYLIFPEPFAIGADFIEPFDDASFELRTVDEILAWLARLHFGRFAGMPVKILWAALELVPPLLLVTGAIMWWNRVLRKTAP
jgi:uncharacterized iron-regulated membrane protein